MAIKTVRNFKVGDLIQGPSAKNPAVAITKICPSSDDERLGRWEIHSVHGVYIVNYDENIQFPRRIDGSIKNWMSLQQHPKPEELAVGDILPPARSLQQIIPPGMMQPNDMDKYYARYIQHVVAVYRYLNTGHVIVKTITPYEDDSLGRATRRSFRVTMGEEIQMPMAEFEGTDTFYRRHFAKRGPYELIANKNTTYWFLVHPTGRGRWPSDANEFMISYEDGEYIMRPPTGDPVEVRKAWRLFQPKATPEHGIGHFVPHPQDMTKDQVRQRYENWKRMGGPATRKGASTSPRNQYKKFNK